MKLPVLKFKSVRVKTMLVMLPLIIIILIAIVYKAYSYSKDIIVEQSETLMREQLERLNYKIQDRVTASSKVPEVFATMVGDDYDEFSLDQYHSFISKILLINKDTFGVGIFFEPFEYDPKTKYFSTYALQEDGKTITSEEYNDPSFDYPNEDFYTSAAGKKGIVFSDPYFDDVRKVNMVTATVPIYNKENQFVGVTTGDIILTKMKEIVAESVIGKTGWAFLIDKNGTYLAGPDTEKIMNVKLQEDSDANLAELGKTLLLEKSGRTSFNGKDGEVVVEFKEMEGTNWILGMALPNKELIAPLKALTMYLIILSLIGILLVAALIYLITRNITKQINKAKEMSIHLAEGDFTHSIVVNSEDEFGQMMNSLNNTSTMLRSMISEVSEHALSVATTSEQLTASAEQSSVAAGIISVNIEEVATGAETQMVGSKNTAQSMDELANGIHTVVEASSVAWEVSQQTSKKAADGNEMIQRAVRDINAANHSVNDTALLIRKLSERAKEIGRITAVIQEISAQTNLLSLNAGIEAARAGEHGLGFSVVAQEIQKLAEQSKVSADGIRGLIEEIQSVTTDAVDSIQSGAETVNRGTMLVNQAGDAFQSILNDISSVAGHIHNISSSSQQMSVGSEEISATVEQLARIAEGASGNSQNVAASCEEQQAAMSEISTSSYQLSEMMQELQQLIAKFKIN